MVASAPGRNEYLQLSWLAANQGSQESITRRTVSDSIATKSKIITEGLENVKPGPLSAVVNPVGRRLLQGKQTSKHVHACTSHIPLSTLSPHPPLPIAAPAGQHLVNVAPNVIQHMSTSRAVMPLEPPNELLEQIHPGSTSRGDFHSDPMTTTWQEIPGYTKNVQAYLSRGRPGPFEHKRVPLSARRRDFDGTSKPRGVRNPPKRQSDDVRNQSSSASEQLNPSRHNFMQEIPEGSVAVPSTKADTYEHPRVLPRRTSKIPESQVLSGSMRTRSNASSTLRFGGQDLEGLPSLTASQLTASGSTVKARPARMQTSYSGSRFVSNPFPSITPVLPNFQLDHMDPAHGFQTMGNGADRTTEIVPHELRHFDPQGHPRDSYLPIPSLVQSGPFMDAQRLSFIREGHDHLASYNRRLVPSEYPNQNYYNDQLYISGFPASFEHRDVMRLLQPCRGLVSASFGRPGPEGSPRFVFAT